MNYWAIPACRWLERVLTSLNDLEPFLREKRAAKAKLAKKIFSSIFSPFVFSLKTFPLSFTLTINLSSESSQAERGQRGAWQLA